MHLTPRKFLVFGRFTRLFDDCSFSLANCVMLGGLRSILKIGFKMFEMGLRIYIVILRRGSG